MWCAKGKGERHRYISVVTRFGNTYYSDEDKKLALTF